VSPPVPSSALLQGLIRVAQDGAVPWVLERPFDVRSCHLRICHQVEALPDAFFIRVATFFGSKVLSSPTRRYCDCSRLRGGVQSSHLSLRMAISVSVCGPAASINTIPSWDGAVDGSVTKYFEVGSHRGLTEIRRRSRLASMSSTFRPWLYCQKWRPMYLCVDDIVFSQFGVHTVFVDWLLLGSCVSRYCYFAVASSGSIGAEQQLCRASRRQVRSMRLIARSFPCVRTSIGRSLDSYSGRVLILGIAEIYSHPVVHRARKVSAMKWWTYRLTCRARWKRHKFRGPL